MKLWSTTKKMTERDFNHSSSQRGTIPTVASLSFPETQGKMSQNGTEMPGSRKGSERAGAVGRETKCLAPACAQVKCLRRVRVMHGAGAPGDQGAVPPGAQRPKRREEIVGTLNGRGEAGPHSRNAGRSGLAAAFHGC